MSILDNEEVKLEHMDKDANDTLTNNLMICLYKLSRQALYMNNVGSQIGRDVFNREVYIGDWVLHFTEINTCEFCQVKGITDKKIRVKYIKLVDLYHYGKNVIYGTKNVRPESLIKISNKSEFYKEFIKN